MKLEGTYSHHGGQELWASRGLYEWITDVFEAPGIAIGNGPTSKIRDHVKAELSSAGWAFNVKVDAESDLTVFSKVDDLAVQLQTGNISRYAYDILKLQHLYIKRVIEGGALCVPTKKAATAMGSNIANMERVINELNIFDRFITCPLMVVAFE